MKPAATVLGLALLFLVFGIPVLIVLALIYSLAKGPA